MEAQKLITMSINKIAGSRRQRGGINLRKNLLVASVLHSARMHYYEEMCNRMPGNIALEHSQPESGMDDDCTESPDWESDDETDEELCGEVDSCYSSSSSSADDNNETAGNPSCEQSDASSRVVVEPVLPVACEHIPAAPVEADKENVDPSSCGHIIKSTHENSKSSDKLGQENYGYYINNPSCNNSAESCERVALGNSTNASANSAVETCTTTTCLVIPSINKRKRCSEEDAAVDSITISTPSSCKRAKLVDSQCQTMPSNDCVGAQHSSISTLVDIFKAGFHGLAGESGGKLTVSTTTSYEYEENDSTSSSSSPSYTTLTSHSRPFETLQAAVIAAC